MICCFHWYRYSMRIIYLYYHIYNFMQSWYTSKWAMHAIIFLSRMPQVEYSAVMEYTTATKTNKHIYMEIRTVEWTNVVLIISLVRNISLTYISYQSNNPLLIITSHIFKCLSSLPHLDSITSLMRRKPLVRNNSRCAWLYWINISAT